MRSSAVRLTHSWRRAPRRDPALSPAVALGTRLGGWPDGLASRSCRGAWRLGWIGARGSLLELVGWVLGASGEGLAGDPALVAAWPVLSGSSCGRGCSCFAPQGLTDSANLRSSAGACLGSTPVWRTPRCRRAGAPVVVRHAAPVDGCARDTGAKGRNQWESRHWEGPTRRARQPRRRGIRLGMRPVLGGACSGPWLGGAQPRCCLRPLATAR